MQEVSILPRRRWVAVFDCVLGVAMCPQDSERDEVGEAAGHSTSAYAKGKPELDRRRITTTIPRKLRVRGNTERKSSRINLVAPTGFEPVFESRSRFR